MKYLRCLTILIVLLGVSSCSNQGKIENLETQVLELEKENKLLKSHIEELEEIISSYESYRAAQRRQAAYQNSQQQQRDWHQQNAQQHLREAEFWRQNGNDFLYESSMRNAQNELNMMP